MSGFQKPHAALIASPGMGHLIPILELGKRMVTYHGFHVTIFVVASDRTATSFLKSPTSQNDHIDIVTLPAVDISGLIDSSASAVAKLLVIMRECLPRLRSSIGSMKSQPTALVVDLFGTDALVVADEFGMLKYVFDTSNAWYLAVTLYASSIDKRVILEDHIESQKPLKVPGCRSLRFEDTLHSLGEAARLDSVRLSRTKMTNSNGILINTWEDLEPSSIRALRDDSLLRSVVKVPIYPIGPLVRKDENKVLDNQVKNWLDKQPSESVIYVSFGSRGTLSAQQTTELAWGLEQSMQRFIWVVRPPSNSVVEEEEEEEEDGTPKYLPRGFFSRTKDIGLVIPMWAPQAQVLSHPSVGGFLSHCGWNSSLESISNGVPMIAWPLDAEQKMNAAMLAEEFGIAVRPKASPSKEIVCRDDIEKMVRKIMVVDDEEGHAMRKRVKELSQNAEKAINGSGSSFNSLSQVAKYCLHHK